MVTLALSKGKLLDEALELLSRAGLAIGQPDDRALVWEAGEWRFLLARSADVPTFVAEGAADLGIVGKDVLWETTAQVAEVADLGFGPCRLVLAGRAGQTAFPPGKPRVATKFPRSTERFFAGRRQAAEVIRLGGSVELAARVGLTPYIVDLVVTGNTLRENGLEELESIAASTARLIANPVSLRRADGQVREAIETIRAVARGGER